METKINDRIKEIRKTSKLSQEEFGKKLGLTRGAITNIELYKTEPKPLFIDLVCKTYNVNINWLYTGDGEMFKQLSPDQEIAKFAAQVIKAGDDSFKKRFIALLAELDPEDWIVLEKLSEKLAQKK